MNEIIIRIILIFFIIVAMPFYTKGGLYIIFYFLKTLKYIWNKYIDAWLDVQELFNNKLK